MLVDRAASALGAFIEDLSVRELLDDEQRFAEFLDAVLEYEVVFLRNQDITPAEFQAFGERFGEIMDHPAYGDVPEAPGVQILESTPDKPSKIEVWHSDMTFSSHPPSFTLLHGQVIPEFGGDTLWASANRAYETLSAPLKQMLLELTAVHDFRHGFQESLAEPGGMARLASAIEANPPIEHPLVRTHPRTGRRSLYVNALFTTHIKELGKLESERLLEFLYRHIVAAEHTVRLRWTPQTIAVWDNRSTQHKPVNDFFPAHRKMHRVTITGERPA